MKKLFVKLCFSIILILSFISINFAQQDIAGKPPNSGSMVPAINFKDTDIRDLLRSIAFEYETNIVIDNEVNNKVSVALFNITLFEAIKIIAEDNGLEFTYDSQRFYINTPQEYIPPPPPENDPVIGFNNGKVKINLDNVDIKKVVEELRNKTGKNFLLTKGTAGKISGELQNIDLEMGLRNILQNNGYYLTIKDSIYYISRSTYFSSIESNNDLSKSPYWVSAQSNRVTIDVNNAKLDKVLSDIFNQLNLEIVKLAVPDATVTVKCSEVPLNRALGFLFKGTEFSFKNEKGTYFIGQKNSKNLDNTRLVKLQYLRADKVKEKIPGGIAQAVNINISLEHNALILTGTNESICNLEDYIYQIDRPVPQVLIEALVIDYNLDNIFQFGINMGRGDSATINQPDQWHPGINVTASGKKINKILNDIGVINLFGEDIDIAKLGKLPDDFYMNVRALEQHGIANVRSKPLLSTLNGHTASLQIGTVQNYVFTEVVPIMNAVNSTFIEKETIEKIEANISFEITPFVNPNNELTLEIKPDFETPVGPFSPDKKLIPAINKRSLLSTVRLKDGETIVLGGMIQEVETSTEDKVPLLGDIPLLGELFTNVDKKKSKSELMIYLTPKIYYGDDFGSLYFDYAK